MALMDTFSRGGKKEIVISNVNHLEPEVDGT